MKSFLPSSPGKPATEWLAALVSAAIAATVAEVVSRRLGLGLVDDAYISLRYSERWAQGLGLSYNTGERVEGFSNFLLVALQALLIRLRVAAETAAWLPAVAGQVLIAPVTFALLRRQGVRSVPVAVLVASLVALEPSLVMWSRSGLEGPLYTLLVLLALHCALLTPVTTRTTAAAMAVAVLGALTRPEGLVLLPLVGMTLARHREARSMALRGGLVALAVCGACLIVRHSYYGFWLPNTYYAKLDGGSLALAVRGGSYVGTAMIAVLPSLLLLLATFWLVRPAGPAEPSLGWLRVVLIWIAVLSLVVAWEGGDYLPMYRFMTPIFALVAVAALGPWISSIARHGERSIRARLYLAGTLLASLVGWLSITSLPSLNGWNSGSFVSNVEDARLWVSAGEMLDERSPPDAVIGALAIGGIGYGSHRVILDALGLVDSHTAHVPRSMGTGMAGHEKFDVDYFFDRNPDAIVLPPRPVDMRLKRAWVNTVVGGGFLGAIKVDPRLDDDYQLFYLPVGPRHWLHTFIRRDAVSRWKVDDSMAATP